MGEYALGFYVTLGLATAIGIGFSMPKLTEDSPNSVRSTQLEGIAKQEASYCRQNIEDVNCVCFAGKSTQVLTYEAGRIPNAEYPDPKELARNQAHFGC